MSTSTQEAPAVRPGIRQGMTRAEYDAIPAINQSLLKHFRRSAAHFRHEQLTPSESTDAQELGTAIHCAVLEPKRFAESYVRAPKFDRRTTKGKQDAADFENANVGKSVIKPEDHETCLRIAEAIAGNEVAAELLSSPGRQELGVVWIDPETGLACKALIDRIATDPDTAAACVVDIKSTRDASERAFARDCFTYGYHIQAAWYLDGLNVLGPARRRFIFVAVEKEPPYGVAVYELDAESIDQGRREFRDYLAQYARCLEAGIFPGYPDFIQPISLPRWAFTKEFTDGTV